MRTRNAIAILISFIVFFCCAFFLWLAMATLMASTVPEVREAVKAYDYTPVPVIVRTPPTFEEMVTARFLVESAKVPERDLLDLAMRLKKPSQPIKRIVRETPLKYKIGDQEAFWISDQRANVHFTATATLRYITPHLYMWVENGYDVNEDDLRRSAERFENRTYPTNRRFFGSEWTPGVDSDPHVHIFNGHVPGVSGYYSSSDEYSRAVTPFSNERELFYVNLDNVRPGNDYYDGILAHEFQHMIHWNIDRNEDTWVNEGLSELASYLNGYDVGGSQWAFQNKPDTQLTSWADTPDSAAPHYGASYLFMTYFLDRFGEDVLRRVVAHEANGLAGFDQVLAEEGLGLTIEDVFADWLIANYLDASELTADGRYRYRDLSVEVSLDHTHVNPDQRSATVHQYAADYIELKGNGDDMLIDFTASTVVKLADKEPHSGRYEWWSNRADEADTTLTRAFDLRGKNRATLQVWLWYDIEEHWDYAYIEASTDGGRTWDILEGRYTVDANPNGNSFGHAYTGKSKAKRLETDEAKPQWVLEEIDLTPYAGQEILLRFEHVTDDAVNHPGLFVDDIAIPELGYYYDAEEGDGGWIAEGFIRTDNFVPQRFLVQLIEFGPEVASVRKMEVDEMGKGQMIIEGLGDEVERAVLVVSALAPATTELASCAYSIESIGGGSDSP